MADSQDCFQFIYGHHLVGGPEKAGCWSHPGVACLFASVWCLWYGNVQCLLDLFKVDPLIQLPGTHKNVLGL